MTLTKKIEGHLFCSSCRTYKPYAEMSAAEYILRKKWNTGECKPCKRKRNPQSPESGRKHWLMKAYGLTEENYQNLLDDQGGLCAICRRPPRKKLHVDHDHSCCPTKISCGKCIRGLLCSRCNSSLEWNLRFKNEAEKYVRNLIGKREKNGKDQNIDKTESAD